MPYINKERRKNLLYTGHVENIGELNYMFTCLAIKYIKDHGLSYDTLNAVMGAFDCAAKEFNRRLIVPYENTKINSNGDVYPSLTSLLTFNGGCGCTKQQNEK